jgi:hypothetical protein
MDTSGISVVSGSTGDLMLDALAMAIPPTLKRGRFQVPDKLMAMFKEVRRPV